MKNLQFITILSLLVLFSDSMASMSLMGRINAGIRTMGHVTVRGVHQGSKFNGSKQEILNICAQIKTKQLEKKAEYLKPEIDLSIQKNEQMQKIIKQSQELNKLHDKNVTEISNILVTSLKINMAIISCAILSAAFTY